MTASAASYPSAPLVPVQAADLGVPGSLAEAAVGEPSAVGIPVVQGTDGPALADGLPGMLAIGSRQLSTAIPAALVARHGFTAKKGESLVVEFLDGPAVVFLGCGPAASLTAEALRQASAALVRSAGRAGVALFVLPAALLSGLARPPSGRPPADSAARGAVQAVAEAAVLASYRFTVHKSSAEANTIATMVIGGLGIEPEVLSAGVRRGQLTAEAACFARDLVNEPPSTMSPSRLADAFVRFAAGRPGLGVEIWDERRIAAERLGGLLAVARGSIEPPRLVRASFDPADPVVGDGRVPHVVLVGKGITFDSGGISLKSPESMMTMKTDMSGAAAVLATVAVCGELGVRVKVTAIAPVTENMPGGRAQKPGDVFTARNGKTIEVLNTDAEGRLVLADGLSLAAELEPDAIVDLATLTGAAVVALGGSIAGIFANNEALMELLGQAAESAGERAWPLPLAEEYRPHIESEVADMKNIGKAGQAGAIVAALLLERFVDELPWAHLDIAGPARSEENSGVFTKGGTGFGVRLLLEFLDHFAAAPTVLRSGG
ncbi:MAG TPA: leucyl aminopeptidase [Acidimicrobiales bacterium]|nr:leucyl aminopeptidase [Acidimicrobiales bacterium]